MIIESASYNTGFAPRDGQPLYPSLRRGLTGQWSPCLGPSGLTLREWGGKARHGTLTNGPTWVPRGRYAIQTDGASQSVVLSNQSVLLPATGFTISTWIMATAAQPSVFGGYFISDNDGSALTVALRIQNDVNIQAFTNAGATDAISASSVVTVGVWLHVALVVAATNLKLLYINGDLAGTSTVNIARGTTTSPIHLGRSGDGFANLGLVGLQDDVLFYERVLPHKEIKLLAIRRGIASELAPRRRASTAVAFNRRRRLLVGAHS